MRMREIWVDNVKVFACILVVLGHFFQSMVKAAILPESDFYLWFIQTIYYFHVPLFFICSGYLYQKFSNTNSVQGWFRNVLKKALILGVPYFVFSSVTWALKLMFSASVNSIIEHSLMDVLFVHPMDHFWYLYALFYLFMITPTFSSSKIAMCGIGVTLFLKLFIIVKEFGSIPIISYIFSNEVWFVIGMCINFFDWEKKIVHKSCFVLGALSGVGFVVLSIHIFLAGTSTLGFNFLMGIMACFSVIAIMGYLFRNKQQKMLLGFLSKYTMYIYLMHTLFAASLRTLLLKIGIESALLHVPLGLLICFAGPIIAALIMEKWKWMDFIVHPDRFVKISVLQKF